MRRACAGHGVRILFCQLGIDNTSREGKKEMDFLKGAPSNFTLWPVEEVGVGLNLLCRPEYPVDDTTIEAVRARSRRRCSTFN
jgi:hypothetical protein